MRSKVCLFVMLILACMMIRVQPQCVGGCNLGSFCQDYNNTNGTDSYICVKCQSNCLNCSSQDTCNQCQAGYSYILSNNDGVLPIESSSNLNSGYCVQCIADCASCTTNVTGCDSCNSGYAYNGSTCSSVNLDVEPLTTANPTQFNTLWIIAIVGGIIALGLIVTISYYCVMKRRQKMFIIQAEPSLKDQMVNGVPKNQFTIYEEPSTRE